MNLGFLQPYSLLILAIILLAIVAAVLFRRRPRLSDMLAFGGIILALVVVYMAIRPVQTSLMGDAAHVQAQIGKGKPVLFEFQSPYCLGCTQIKPQVDQVEQQFQEKLLVLRVNIQEQAGRELIPVYGFQYTPTFIFFDEQGHETWRSVGYLDETRLQEEMKRR